MVSSAPSMLAHFNPRSPRGGATNQAKTAAAGHAFQSTLPTRGSDFPMAQKFEGGSEFQSTLPTRGSDAIPPQRTAPNHAFQSTLPTRGSDLRLKYIHTFQRNFNPRSPRGGATHAAQGEHIITIISIHAPHEGERLRDKCRGGIPCRISIHAPHEGERQADLAHDARRKRISIHAPHEGERQ